MKRFGQLLIVALFATTAWTTSANAAPAWFNVDLVLIGTQGGETVVMLTDQFGSFSDTWFKVDASITKESLAIALTAASLSKAMVVYADPVSVPDALVFKMFLAN